MHKKNHYAEEGVRNAVRAFRAKGLSVVVVSKRRCTVDMFKEDGEVKVRFCGRASVKQSVTEKRTLPEEASRECGMQTLPRGRARGMPPASVMQP